MDDNLRELKMTEIEQQMDTDTRGRLFLLCHDRWGKSHLGDYAKPINNLMFVARLQAGCYAVSFFDDNEPQAGWQRIEGVFRDLDHAHRGVVRWAVENIAKIDHIDDYLAKYDSVEGDG